jgi:hypothetical protein
MVIGDGKRGRHTGRGAFLTDLAARVLAVANTVLGNTLKQPRYLNTQRNTSRNGVAVDCQNGLMGKVFREKHSITANTMF